ncbi:MAG: shikimate kinase [Clostridiales bacterium]|nr:shikimate kinase [Clostridiales bacterium]
MKKNLILIGFMGAGKTTVGGFLAREKGMQFVDTDERIVSEQGRSIPDIFAEEGEAYFRDLETDLLRRMQEDTRNAVISVGGGMPVREENRELLRSLGCVIYLSATRETILGRVRSDGSRPMLEGGSLEARVDKLMQEREALYKQAAHLDIKTDGRSVYQVAQVIMQETRRFR